MRGRKPKPSGLKLIEGNRGHRPINDKEPSPARLTFSKPPKILGVIGRGEWLRLMRDVVPLGFITVADLGLLMANCRLFEKWIDAEQRLDKTGPLIVVKGRPVPNPFIRVARDHCRDYVKSCAELGITPSSRSRVKIVDDQNTKDDLADEFFK